MTVLDIAEVVALGALPQILTSANADARGHLYRRTGEALADQFFLWLETALETGEIQTVDHINEAGLAAMERVWLCMWAVQQAAGHDQAEIEANLRSLRAAFTPRLEAHFTGPQGGAA